MGEDYDGVERRQDRRFSLRVPLYIASGEDIFSKTIHLRSRDVSAGGVSFDTSRELELEAESQIIFPGVGDLNGTYIIRGRVAWTKLLPDTGRFQVGVQFNSFEGVTREELVDRIDEWVKAQEGS
jgi:c-di-GMP-binding flagellar brake protein YcgR